MSSNRNALAVLVLPFVAVACGDRPEVQELPQQVVQTTTPCDSMSGAGAGLLAEGWGGSWRLTLVATSGPSVGHQVSGPLTLQDSPAALQTSVGGSFSAPWYGSAIVDVGAVGALDLGGIEGTDVTAPGVLVMVASGGGRAMMRLGTQANRVGLERFDGGFTVLNVLEGSADSLRGSWRSGAGEAQASGHFCARRG